MSMKHLYRILTCLFSLALIGLLAACGSNPPTGNGQTPTPGGTTPGATATLSGGHPPVLTPTTASVPPTQTSCPAAGTARPAVLAYLVLGSHANIVYNLNQYQGTTPAPTFATLKRYDVTTGSTTDIVKVPGNISFAQVSSDGQWILFVSAASSNSAAEKLQLVRMDGQGLQTLYCGAIQSPQWSVDQKHVVFSASNGGSQGAGTQTIYLLDTSSGKLQSLLTTSFANSQSVVVRTWLDNTHIYLTNTQTDAPPSKIYILDITKGSNQQMSSLHALVNQTFGDFDSSYDGSHLYVDYGYCGYGCTAPGRITVQAASGGAETSILNSPKYDTVSVRVITNNTLLVEIRNQGFGNSQADESHNGLWKMNADGSGLTQLYADQSQQVSGLNSTSQYPWSNASRDGKLYALQVFGSHAASTLLFGSLSGGSTTSFVSASNGSDLEIVGWTTM